MGPNTCDFQDLIHDEDAHLNQQGAACDFQCNITDEKTTLNPQSAACDFQCNISAENMIIQNTSGSQDPKSSQASDNIDGMKVGIGKDHNIISGHDPSTIELHDSISNCDRSYSSLIGELADLASNNHNQQINPVS